MFIKHLLFLALLGTTFNLTAQTTIIRNLSLTDENSKTIYRGMENKFKISNLVGHIKVDAKTLRYSLHEDTLILWPNLIGPIIVSFATKQGSDQVLFMAKRLPDITVSIGGTPNKWIRKAELLNNRQITITNADDVLADFVVDSTVIHLNERRFQIKDYLSDDLLEAINNNKEGKRLEVAYLRLKNVRTGRAIVKTDKTTYELK